MNLDSLAYEENYQKNLDFWETAWQRVSKAVNTPPDFEYVKKIPNILKKYQIKSVLDLACGSGWLAFMLAEAGFKTLGVDISKSAIKLAMGVKEDLYHNNINAEFQVQDILSMDLEQKYDLAIINASFEHFDLERGKLLLKNVKNSLNKPGFIYGVYDHVGFANKGEFIELDDGTKQYLDQYRNGMFLRSFSDEELRAIFRDLDFEIIEWDYVDNNSRSVLVKV